jgi:hypothetical protein
MIERIRSFFSRPGAGETSYSSCECVFMRLGFAWLVYKTIDWGVDFHEQPHPNGPAQFLDLTFFSDPAVMGQIHAITILGLVFFVAGLLPQLALTWILFVMVGVGSLANSQGAIGHYTQLVAMIVMAQALAHWTRPRELFTSLRTENRAIGWSLIVIAAGYMVCGWVKFVRSAGLWAWNSPMLAVQFVKTRQMYFFDQPDLQASASWIDRVPELIVAYPNMARLAFGAALLLELAGFLALTGRRTRAVYGLSLIGMHLSISLVMNLYFKTNIIAIVIFLVNPPFWIACGIRYINRLRANLVTRPIPV